MFAFKKCVITNKSILREKHSFNSVLSTSDANIFNLKLSTYLRSPHKVNVFCKVVCIYMYLNLYSVKNLVIMNLK